MKLKSKEQRLIDYRKFFAGLRLNRLYFQVMILNFFLKSEDPKIKQEITSELQSYDSFFDEIDIWICNLRQSGNYEEFREQCKQELLVTEQIINSYKKRIEN